MQSRYYNPELGRFINADAFATTGQGLLGNNMFAYCGNNPMLREDDEGKLWNVVAGAVIGGLLGGVSKAIECVANGESVEKVIAQVLVSTACGAIGGALAATGIGLVGQGVIGGVLGAAESAVNQLISTGEINSTRLAIDTVSGAAGGLIGGKGAAHGHKFMAYHRKQFVKNASIEGLSEAIIKFGKHTWKWTKSNLKGATYWGVIRAFVGNKVVNISASAMPWLAPT